MILSFAALRALALATGFADPNLAAAIAVAESGGNPCALGDPHASPDCTAPPTGPSTSIGLWQIHLPAHPKYDPSSLLDPNYNARAAFEISGGGRDWSAWGAYTNGSYAQYLPAPSITSSRAGLGLLAVALGVVALRRSRVMLF